MKYLFLPLFFLFFSTCTAWCDGIEFSSLSWEEALIKAEEENKLIFLDAYTTWCGPCKKMTREVFPVDEVGAFFNARFVSVKMDMEKGEGLEIARHYRIGVFPTLLFVGPDGKPIHRAAGFHTVDEFLALGKIALNPEKRLGTMEAAYEQGNKDPEFLLKYYKARAELQDGSHLPILEDYLTTQEDWTTEENLDLIYQMTSSADSKLFYFMVDNKQLFIDRVGQRAVDTRIQDLVYQTVYNIKEESSMQKADEIYTKVYPEKAARMSANFRMNFYRQKGDRTNFAKSAINYFKNYPEARPDELNDVAWTFYQVIEDKKLLKHACKWSRRSVEIDPQYYNYDTLAGIYQKMGKKKKAIQAAQAGIAIAEQTGDDFSKTKVLLEELLQ